MCLFRLPLLFKKKKFDIDSWLEESDSERLTNDKLHTKSSHNELSAYTIICLKKEPLLNEIITNEN